MHPAQPWDGLQGALTLPPSGFPYIVLLKAGRLADTAQGFRQLNPSGETDPGPCRVEATLLGAGAAPPMTPASLPPGSLLSFPNGLALRVSMQVCPHPSHSLLSMNFHPMAPLSS